MLKTMCVRVCVCACVRAILYVSYKNAHYKIKIHTLRCCNVGAGFGFFYFHYL